MYFLIYFQVIKQFFMYFSIAFAIFTALLIIWNFVIDILAYLKKEFK